MNDIALIEVVAEPARAGRLDAGMRQ